VTGRLGDGSGPLAPGSGPGHAIPVSRWRSSDGHLKLDLGLDCSGIKTCEREGKR
jgi:hypothetical protein